MSNNNVLNPISIRGSHIAKIFSGTDGRVILDFARNRIRHYGLQANRDQHRRLAHCRHILGQRSPEPRESETVEAMMLRLTGTDIHECPKCRQGKLHQIECIPPGKKPIVTRATGPPDYEALMKHLLETH